MTETSYANCASCGTPVRIDFDEDGWIKEVFAVCKCERPTPEEANAAVRAKEKGAAG